MLVFVLMFTFVYVSDIDECKDKTACQCPQCKCKNTWGSYECSCGGYLLYMREHDTCISQFLCSNSSNLHYIIYDIGMVYSYDIWLLSLGKDGKSEVSWGFVWVIILGLAVTGVAGYAFYKYRVRVSY